MTVREEKRDILEADLASLKVINSFLIMKVIYAQCALKYLNIFRCGSLLLSVCFPQVTLYPLNTQHLPTAQLKRKSST